jgi:hypothetical protein
MSEHVSPPSRRAKKLKLRKGGSFPIFSAISARVVKIDQTYSFWSAKVSHRQSTRRGNLPPVTRLASEGVLPPPGGGSLCSCDKPICSSSPFYL